MATARTARPSRPQVAGLESPLRFIAKAKNKKVLVKLKDGSEYVGILELVDGTMNIVLSDAQEIDPNTGNPVRKYGKIMIRGSFILFVALDATQVTITTP